MKRTGYGILVAILTSCLFNACKAPAPPPEEQEGAKETAQTAIAPVVWKVQTPWPQALWQHKTAIIWAEDIEKLSGGRMKIDLYSTDELVPAFEVYDAVRVGTLDAGHTWAGYCIGKFPALTLFAATPAFFDLLGYLTWMYEGGGKALWQEVYGDKVVVFPGGMLWAEGGGWANKRIESLNDFKGLKYRTVLIWGQILSEVGASVVTLPAGDIVPSLQRGTLDAAEFSTPSTDITLGFHEVAKYCYFPGLHQIAGFQEVIINPNKWNELPDDLKEIVKGACDMSVSRALTGWLMDDCRAVQKFKEYGTEVRKFSEKMQKEILDKFVDNYNSQEDPTFQKVWNSQKAFLKLYAPYMDLQEVDAEVDVNQ
jgi:TRAP-type mannitol/chloroaromatic compound transport system substrate-binding protein